LWQLLLKQVMAMWDAPAAAAAAAAAAGVLPMGAELCCPKCAVQATNSQAPSKGQQQLMAPAVHAHKRLHIQYTF
jgi:hypothetical protein